MALGNDGIRRASNAVFNQYRGDDAPRYSCTVVYRLCDPNGELDR